MSDQKLISPLLDGFVMGDPLSSHDGVCCCPAMKENSDEKYIVKIISIPASQKELDALLLTGAYPDAASAVAYFKELTDGTVKEAELLQQLSKLEGFLSYEGWQVVPMDDKLGYRIYLVGTYKRSLEKFLRRNTMTHLGAVNLGLDLCAALAICRRAGYLFVDLKPENIYLTGEREYRIGDLGFARLGSMKYTSLPAKYRSRYTPPELHDALATMNPTADIDAVGMILYQIYNNGVLPFEEKAPNKVLPAPQNADYEMAEIIQKAIAPNPRNRYQTPIEMGQALVSYMQRNTINDVPIVPPAAPAPVPEPVGEPEAAEPTGEPAVDSVEPQDDLSFMDGLITDETAPGDEDSAGSVEMTAEGSDLLAQADDLLAGEPADTSEAPAQTDTPADSGEQPDSATPAEPDASPASDDLYVAAWSQKDGSGTLTDEYDTGDDDDDDEDDEPAIAESSRPTGKKKHAWIGVAGILLVLAIAVCGGLFFYRNYYLLNIDKLYISGAKDTITVDLTTEVDESLLTVVCTDTYGNRKTAPVQNGQAVFTELSPGTQYSITLEVAGFHKLHGSTTGKYGTQEQTNIVDFTAKTGPEDGSVVLNFTVEGPETQDWIVEYTAEDEPAKSVSFTGHMVTINALTVGKTYTFHLASPPGTELYMAGNDTLEFTASQIVMAQNLAIVSCVDGVLTAQWNNDPAVESWTVRCYAENGYDETVTVTEPSAAFSGISTDTAYTVEVLASGMTQSVRAFVTANPTTISGFTAEAPADSAALNVHWDYAGAAPDGGWLLMYSIDGSEAYEVVKCSENKAVIEQRIPKSTYSFTLQAADGSTVFGGYGQFTCPEAPAFDNYGLKASEIKGNLCKTPAKEGWTYQDVSESDYTDNFALGEKISLVLYGTKAFRADNADTSVMFVLRDGQGHARTDLLRTQTLSWKAMWNKRYCTLELPAVPDAPGDYTVELYFDNTFVLSKSFTVSVG